MTGAPKKRSVEILQTLEDDERGLYSGVIGYWDVGGGGDWAVTIRSCFRLDGQDSPIGDGKEEWFLGAGGAITALSDVDAEWDEMVLKLQGVLRAFGRLEVDQLC
jgi:para-aminobenzoate synthetase